MTCLNVWPAHLIICACGNYEKEDTICTCMPENLVRENGYIRLSWCIVCFYDQLENEKKNGGYPISCLCKNAFPGSL